MNEVTYVVRGDETRTTQDNYTYVVKVRHVRESVSTEFTNPQAPA